MTSPPPLNSCGTALVLGGTSFRRELICLLGAYLSSTYCKGLSLSPGDIAVKKTSLGPALMEGFV